MNRGLIQANGLFVSLLLLTLGSCTAAAAQLSGGMQVTLHREGTQWQAEVNLSALQGLPTPLRDLKLRDSEITFAATVLEADLRFAGKISIDRMSGSVEGFQGGMKVATGSWTLTRQGSNPKAGESAGIWTGTLTLEGVAPQPKQPAGSLEFNAQVAQPAYLKQHTKVFFDEAHNNTDTSAGRYKPFADLITSDGYGLTPNREKFSKTGLKGFEVLVIVNASGPAAHRESSPFTPEECEAVRDWVSGGGALLLITDQAPFSTAAAELSKAFGVGLTSGFTIDRVKYNKEAEDQTELVFTRDEGLIGDHPITRGRNAAEQINRIITFTGTSIKGPPNGVSFLKLADTAIDVLPPDRKPSSAEEAPPDHREVSAAGRAQAVALEFGKGRVVVLGEAAMLTAQVASRGFRFGMNVPGIDNRQLALNIMHWLSGLLKVE